MMLYSIENKYYILVGNKYIKVDFKIKDNDVILESNRQEYKERSVKLIVKKQPFDDKFKEEIKKKISKSSNDTNENEHNDMSKNRYNR